MIATRKRILLVDDERLFTESVSKSLRQTALKLEIHTAPNGLVALQIVSFMPLDLVVTDLNMPKMDGIELLEILRHEYPAIPVLVWSAFGATDLEQKCLAMGAVGFEPLPLDWDSFYSKVVSIIGCSTSTPSKQGVA